MRLLQDSLLVAEAEALAGTVLPAAGAVLTGVVAVAPVALLH